MDSVRTAHRQTKDLHVSISAHHTCPLTRVPVVGGAGLDCVVTPTVSRSPACSFQCQIIPSSSKEKAAAAVAAAVANASGSGSVNAGADTSGKTDGP